MHVSDHVVDDFNNHLRRSVFSVIQIKSLVPIQIERQKSRENQPQVRGRFSVAKLIASFFMVRELRGRNRSSKSAPLRLRVPGCDIMEIDVKQAFMGSLLAALRSFAPTLGPGP